MSIDKQKLLDDLNKTLEANQLSQAGKAIKHFIDLINSGCYDISGASEQSEVDRVRESDELKRYKTALRKIVCLNIPMPDEVFNLANDAMEGVKEE